MQNGPNTMIARGTERALLPGASWRATRACCRGWAAAVVVVLFCAIAGWAQSTPGSNGGSNSDRGINGPQFGRQESEPSPDDAFDMVMAEKRMRALNDERQRQIVADANKLLKLAKELNDEVAAANTSSLTPDQLRKIGEIEKLARSVRERTVAGFADVRSPPPPPVFPYPAR